MKILYLHVGTPKTATSAIQKYLDLNRQELELQSFCYPVSLYAYPNIGIRRNAHFLIGTVLDPDGLPDPEKQKQIYDASIAQILASFESYDHVILSDEGLWRASCSAKNDAVFSRLAALGEEHHFTVRVIVYLRRQDEFLISLWNQNVKSVMHLTKTWDEFLDWTLHNDTKILKYGTRIAHFAKLFGRENLIVRRFDSSDWHGGSLIDDFLHCVGLQTTEAFQTLENPVNTRLLGNTIEIKRIINSGDFSPEDRQYFLRYLHRISPQAGSRYAFQMMTTDETQTFLEAFSAENERVRKQYLDDGKPLFAPVAENALPKWRPDNPHMTEDLILFFAALAIDQHNEIERQKSEIKKLSARLSSVEGRQKKLSAAFNAFRHKIKHPFQFLLSRIFRSKTQETDEHA